jgi:excisionase family DNA binding protein
MQKPTRKRMRNLRPEPKGTVKFTEAARLLGCSIRTFYRMVDDGFPVVHLDDGRRRIRLDDIESRLHPKSEPKTGAHVCVCATCLQEMKAV